jgi:CRP-like cAMP-binding protein
MHLGVNIITQGEQGDTFYVIAQGKCDVLINKNDGAGDKCVITLKELDYFGERALLTSDPRAATVLTKSQVKVFSIGKSAFEQVLGSLAKIIDQDRLKREKLAEASAAVANITFNGVVSSDSVGYLLLGSFGTYTNVTSRTFIYSGTHCHSPTYSLT